METWVLLGCIGFACFLAAVLNATFATGGIYILLALGATILPISVAIPLLPLFAAGSLIGRCVLFRQYIVWEMVGAFSLGAALGGLLGARVFIELSDNVIGLLLGCVLLIMTWMPKTRFSFTLRHPYFFVGGLHTFVSTVLGVGAVLQAIIIRSSLGKLQVTATIAACTAVMEVFKFSGYLAFGFDYSAYLPHVVVATLAGLIGTWVGRHFAHRVPDSVFRPVFKTVLTLVALRFLWQSL